MSYFKAQKNLHTGGEVFARSTVLCVYQLSKIKAHWHYLKIVCPLFLCANPFLFNITWRGHESPNCCINFLQYFSSLSTLTSNLEFPPTHSCWGKSISATETQKWQAGVGDEHKVIPRHPSFPNCRLPLRQRHFLSSSLGINSCIPGSCPSQEEGCVLPKMERNDTLIFRGE